MIGKRIKDNTNIKPPAFKEKRALKPKFAYIAIFPYSRLRHPFSHYGIADVHFIGMFFIAIFIVSENVCINTIV